MSDIVIIFLVHNVLVFLLIFWLLTWLTEYFFKKKVHLAKNQFYECGFRTLSELNIQINANFSLLCIFLILYDIEFTFLFPFLFNVFFVLFLKFIIFFLFLLLIFLSLYYDYQFNALNWQF